MLMWKEHRDKLSNAILPRLRCPHLSAGKQSLNLHHRPQAYIVVFINIKHQRSPQ